MMDRIIFRRAISFLLVSSRYREFCKNSSDDVLPYLFNWDDMMAMKSKLKCHKSTSTFLKAEHLLFGSLTLFVHMQLLFNSMLLHSYVPHEFLKGIITPLVKDQDGDLSDTGNYRGVWLSPVFAFLFEHGLLIKFGYLLQSDELQFGYKSKHSTNHAIFVLRTCIDFLLNMDHMFLALF